MTCNLNYRVHPAILHAIRVKRKILRRLKKPVRSEYSSTTRFNRAVEKRLETMKKFTQLLIVILRERDTALATEASLREAKAIPPEQEFYHTISLTKMYCIMAGGMRIIRSQDGFQFIPKSSTYNEETKMLVGCFFEQRLRGTKETGSSKWVVKQVPNFSTNIITILNSIYEDNVQSFKIIAEYIVKKDNDVVSFNFLPLGHVDPENLELLVSNFTNLK